MPRRVLNSEMIYKARMFSVAHNQIELPDGKVIERDIVIHPGAVVIIPQCADGRIMLVRQYRDAIKTELLELPAGTLELGEPPARCAERELSEEVGQRASEWIDLGTIYPAPGFCDEIQHGFLARGLSPFVSPGDEDEQISVETYSVQEIEALIRDGKIPDGKSAAFLYRARLRGLI